MNEFRASKGGGKGQNSQQHPGGFGQQFGGKNSKGNKGDGKNGNGKGPWNNGWSNYGGYKGPGFPRAKHTWLMV